MLRSSEDQWMLDDKLALYACNCSGWSQIATLVEARLLLSGTMLCVGSMMRTLVQYLSRRGRELEDHNC